MRYILSLLLSSLAIIGLANSEVMANTTLCVPVLAYHNFDPSIPGEMTISTEKFEDQLKWLKENDYTVIPLQKLVSYLRGETDSVPEKSVVITADDGRKSVYTYMWPIVRKYNVPVTLFIYPNVISNATYAMTWEQLKELQETGLFDIQGHTYWHPNFKQEKKRLSATEYQKLIHVQLVKSKEVINKKLGTDVNLLAWPFGIYDQHLEEEATKAGYIMAFSIDGRPADKLEQPMSQPRYMILQGHGMKAFAAIVSGNKDKK